MNHLLLGASLLFSPLLAIAAPASTDLSMVPQLHETKEQRDERMQWFRDGKYGMFIHWGPCTIGAKEIGWGREGNRPWDINKHGPRTSDPEYDAYYKSFNPVKFDADALVQLAKKSGMKYMVLVTKHHDGFSMFDTKQSDYSIMHTPYGRDVVKAFADACHRHGMKMGLYYSTRDWYHPDYLVGDNKKYDAWYQEQIRELLTNYGNVDVMWFDHVGGHDWSKWRFDDLFSMMYRLQPGMLVNNRAAKFCGPTTKEDKGPATKELETITQGDYYTPEGRIGSLDIQDDWESCIHIGQGWSYGGEEGFQTPENCIKMLVSCTTSGGNLLLNVGPRADGTLTDGEFQSVKAVGAWLEKYGEAIYGTRGGPFKNGRWGGSCHKGNKVFLHVYQWPEGGRLEFDPLPRKVLSARTLDGAPVDVTQSDEKLSLGIAKEAQVSPVTVVELTIDNPIEPGTLFGRARVISDNMSEFGHDLGKLATLFLSSTSEHDNPEDHEKLFRGERPESGYAFHTKAEENPTALIDLQRISNINAILIENRPGDRRSEGLIVSISMDGKQWDQIWQAPEWKEKWLVPVNRFHAGITIPGRNARFIRVETKGNHPRPLILQRMTILGDYLAQQFQNSVDESGGWENLFAADLSNAQFPEGVWTFSNGELTASEDQVIWTKNDYENFVLDLEFKTGPDANSGVIVYASDKSRWVPNSVEIQLLDDAGPKWAKADPKWKCGAIFGRLAPSQSAVKPTGEWNHCQITCRGPKIDVVLNGQPVTSFDMTLWRSGTENPDGSKMPPWLNKPLSSHPTKGAIGLQGKHGGAPIWFRNIKIKPLG